MKYIDRIDVLVLCAGLGVILALQVSTMVRSDRVYESLNRVERVLEADRRQGWAHRSERFYPGQRGDWLNWAFTVEPKTLNPISIDADAYTLWITSPFIFEPLLNYCYDTMELIPWLAESYHVSDDGLEYVFELRRDVVFSDGQPLTADDVIFTFETLRNPQIDAANRANLYVDVDRAERLGDYTVRFVLDRPHFKMLENLSFWQIGVLPKHVYEFDDPMEFNRRISEPVGTGPYVFERWDVGSRILMSRNELYWGLKPNLEKVAFRFIRNPLAAKQALEAGQVDMIMPEPEQYADLASDQRFSQDYRCLSYWHPMVPFFYIGWNMDSEIFSDRPVRLAMTLMLDRPQLVEQLLRGEGEVVSGPFYIFGDQQAPDVEPWPYDMQEAARLLEEAGWVDTTGDGIRDRDGRRLSFEFMYPAERPLYTRLAAILADQGARLGVDVRVEPSDWSVVITRINDRDFDAVVMGWTGDIEKDPYQLWHSSQAQGRGNNYVGFRNDRADELIEEARRTLDADKRNAMFHELHRILHYEQPYTFLFTRPTFRIVDKRFENVNVRALGLNYLEWYVPAEQQRYE